VRSTRLPRQISSSVRSHQHWREATAAPVQATSTLIDVASTIALRLDGRCGEIHREARGRSARASTSNWLAECDSLWTPSCSEASPACSGAATGFDQHLQDPSKPANRCAVGGPYPRQIVFAPGPAAGQHFEQQVSASTRGRTSAGNRPASEWRASRAERASISRCNRPPASDKNALRSRRSAA